MRVLQQYKGQLTPADAADGMNAAITNAKRLAEDASLLFGRGRYPTASSLAILSLEEQGKCAILRELLSASSDNEIADCWKILFPKRVTSTEHHWASSRERRRRGVPSGCRGPVESCSRRGTRCPDLSASR